MRAGRRLSLAVLAVTTALVGSAVAVPSALADNSSSMVAMVNSARASAGLHGYTVAYDLAAVAQGQAQRMATAQRLYHNPALASQVHNWRYVGENVGYGPDAATLFSAFMHSPPHRANILDHDFTQIGIGSVTVNGTLWVSMVFREPMTSTPTSTHTTHVTSHVSHATSHRTAQVRHGSSASHRGVRGTTRARTAGHPRAHGVGSAADLVPPGVVCSAGPPTTARLRDLTAAADSDRTVLQVHQGQLLLRGFQCGRRLPMTGVFDPATLLALNGA